MLIIWNIHVFIHIQSVLYISKQLVKDEISKFYEQVKIHVKTTTAFLE